MILVIFKPVSSNVTISGVIFAEVDHHKIEMFMFIKNLLVTYMSLYIDWCFRTISILATCIAFIKFELRLSMKSTTWVSSGVGLVT